MALRLFTCIAALSCAVVAHAQPEAAPRVVRTLGDPGQVVCVESEGAALWAGTRGAGVFRIEDGSQERFDAVRGLPGNRVRDCERYRGALWVATEAGLARFDSATRRFERVLSGRYLRVAAFGETLIAARADGVVQRFERGRGAGEQRVFAVPSTLAIAATRWALGAVDGSLYLAEEGSEPRLVSIPEQPDGAPEPIEAIAFDGTALAIKTASHALRVEAAAKVAVRAGETGRDRLVREPALGELLVNDRVHIKGGGEAIATDGGLFVRARPGAALEPVALGGLPCGDRISALAVQGDVLWIGSFDRGLCRLDAHGVEHFRGPRFLPSDMVNALSASATQLFVATVQGLTIVDRDGTFTSFTEEQCAGQLSARCDRAGLAGDHVLSVREIAGRTFVGTLHGLNVEDGDRVTTLTSADGLSGDEVHDAVEYAGAIWVATDGGLSVLEFAGR